MSSFFGRDSFSNDEDHCAEDHNDEVREQRIVRDPFHFGEDLAVEEVQHPSHERLTPQVIDRSADAHDGDDESDCSERFLHVFRL